MQEKSYSSNYLKIYLWRTLSIASGFLSLLLVVPYLSSNQELYGIYSFCISFTLYLTYADIGFLGAGQKYAAEEFAKGNKKAESEIFGFTGFILLLMIVPFSIAMIYLSFNPRIILNNLSSDGSAVAGKIFLILGVFSPFQLLLQRLTQSILLIRIKDYVSLKIDNIFNLLRICSIFIFFGEGKYLVVEYFLVVCILTIISSLVTILIIRKTEAYNFSHLIKNIKFQRKYFNLTKKLALTSLFLTVSWIIYYELDVILIGKIFGPQQVAIYAIGFTFLNFLRNLWNIVFSPYSQRFNHFAAAGQLNKMKQLTTWIIDYTLPLCVVVTLLLVICSKYIVIFWVGKDYFQSILILKYLIISAGFGFIIQPASYFLISMTRYRFLNLLSVALPLVFIVSLIFFIRTMGISGFALSKLVAMSASAILSGIALTGILNPLNIIKKWIPSLLIFSVLTGYFIPDILNTIFSDLKKDTKLLFLLFLFIGSLTLIATLLLVVTQRRLRNNFRSQLLPLLFKKNTTVV